MASKRIDGMPRRILIRLLKKLGAYPLTASLRIHENHADPSKAVLVVHRRYGAHNLSILNGNAAPTRTQAQEQFPVCRQLVPTGNAAKPQTGGNVVWCEITVYDRHKEKAEP